MPRPRTTSHEKITINLQTLNDLKNPRASYLLHRLLTESKDTREPGNYSFADAKATLTLSNILTPVITQDNQIAYYQVDGNDDHRIYLFSIGVCYHETPPNQLEKLLEKPTDELLGYIEVLSTTLKKRIDELNAAEYKKLKLHYLYDTPIIYEFYKLRLAIDQVIMTKSKDMPEGIAKYLAQFTREELKTKMIQLKRISERFVFFTQALEIAREQWTEEQVPEQDRDAIFLNKIHHKFYDYFFGSSPYIYSYFEERPFLFQGKQFIFPRRLVVRERETKEGVKKPPVIDILKKEAMEKTLKSDIYEIDEISVLRPHEVLTADQIAAEKSKTKNEKVYKFDLSEDARAGLGVEFMKVNEHSPELHAGNYHPGFYCMRNKGPNLDKFSKRFKAIRHKESREGLSLDSYQEFMKLFLEIAYKLYERLARYRWFEHHGDIKPENILIQLTRGEKPEYELTLIDANHHYTVLYASPETLKTTQLTRRGDIYSAARSLVRFAGDRHAIFLLGKNKVSPNENINDVLDPKADTKKTKEKPSRFRAHEILELEEPIETLKDFEDILSFFVTKEVISENVKFQIFEFFIRLHSKYPKERPTASEAADKFKDLYQGYCQTLENKVKLSPRAAL